MWREKDFPGPLSVLPVSHAQLVKLTELGLYTVETFVPYVRLIPNNPVLLLQLHYTTVSLEN